MGLLYSEQVLIDIVRKYGKDGLSKEDVIRIHKEKKYISKLEEHSKMLDPKMPPLCWYVYFKEGKYFPRPRYEQLEFDFEA